MRASTGAVNSTVAACTKGLMCIAEGIFVECCTEWTVEVVLLEG